MSYNTEDLFSKLQKKSQEAASATGQSNYVANDLILKPKINNSYSLRLLWLPPEGTCKREYPMINQYVHKYWDEHASGQKGHEVYCPTSQYIKGETRAGFDACPICAECSKLYKQFQEGSSSAEDLYKTFRRTLRGFVPVYVANGPEDVVGQVKILQYSKQFKDFFDRKIFGIATKARAGEETLPINPDDVIGLDAFMYERNGEIVTEGYNLNVSVTSKKMIIKGKAIDMPQYTLDFSRRTSNITAFGDKPITTDYFESLNKELSYDEDFFKESTTAELTSFMMKYMTPETTVQAVNEEPAAAPKMNPYTAAKPAAPVETEVEQPAAVPVNTPTAKADDDIDVDALINGL